MDSVKLYKKVGERFGWTVPSMEISTDRGVERQVDLHAIVKATLEVLEENNFLVLEDPRKRDDPRAGL